MSNIAVSRRCVTLGTFVALLATTAVGPRAEQATTSVTLAWDANQDSAVGYLVHVGTESMVYDELFEVGPATTFTYQSGVPGKRYYFAVSAFDQSGLLSPYSNEVSTIIGGAAGLQSVAEAQASPCCPARVRASTDAEVSSLAPLPDGRVLFVENRRAIRLLGTHGLMSVPALQVDTADTALTEVVVAPHFTESALVFVGMSDERPDGSHVFRIVRYRLVLDTLGEGATVVSGLSYDGAHAPRFAVDDGGRIYVAMPATANGRRDAYAGRILRFAHDGSVPHDNRGYSPIVAEGLAVPRDVDWDRRSIWVTGTDENAQPQVARLTTSASDHAWPHVLDRSAFASRSSLDVVAFDPQPLDAAEDTPHRVAIVDQSHKLHRVTLGAQVDVEGIDATAWPAGMRPADVAVAAAGSILVVLESATGSFAIVEIAEPR
jgi:hypothetical protein